MNDDLELVSEPGDMPARDAIRAQLDHTLFVEAGAGTGKTQALVDRVVALVVDDVPMSAIAAITFTEKAAAELRDRVRRELRARAADPALGEAGADRCRAALDDLDAAAICTLHAFAQRILTEFPIEVGLPPRIEVRDEISSRIAFEARWRAFVDELLEDPELESTVLVLLASNVKLPHLRTVAEILDDNWDLLDRIDAPAPLPALQLDGWLDELSAICDSGDECRADTDGMLTRLAEFAEYRDRLRAAFDDAERIELLRSEKPSFKVSRTGSSKNWPDVNSLRDRIIKLGEQREAMTGAMLNVAIKRAVAAIAVYIGRAVAERRVSGALDFHDLLVLARTLLRDPEHGTAARERLRGRYRRILIDEFQDTDPIQVELAALLGSTDPADGARPWQDMTIDPGRLFFVGDPKQSIYRFRRADIATFLDAQDRFAVPAPLFLTCNFRTAPAVLDWINHVFAELIQAFPASQPEYRALDPARPVPPEHDRGVVLLGVEPHDDEGTDAAGLRIAGGGRRRRDRPRRGGRAVAGVRPGDQGLASGAARRRVHPVAGAHVARVSRTGACGSGGAVSRRDELARLQQPRDPRPADDPAGGRRLEQRARARCRHCDRRCSGAATTTCSRTTWSTAAAGMSPHPSRRRTPTRFRPVIPSPPRCAFWASCTRPACGRRRASCSSASCENDRSSRSARSPDASATSPAGCDS